MTIDEPGPRAGLTVAVDEDVASRVLQPVLENACRYSRTRVTVSITGTQGSVEFVISDDGRGVADAERGTIFDPGQRGDGARGRTDGAGLGLPLARLDTRSTNPRRRFIAGDLRQ